LISPTIDLPAVVDPSATDLQWCVVQARPNREATVARTLRVMGFDEFYPVERVRHLKRGRTETFDRPLYPTYLFASFADENQRHEIRMVRDVTGLLITHGHRQDRLTRDVDSLRRWLGEHPDLQASDENYRAGDLVRVVGGPLATTGTVGRFIRRHRKVQGKQITRDVLLVGVEMLGRMVEVELDALCVEPL
jgi:transcription antitermination factor NusG